MKKLFLDDERFPVGDGWAIVRSVEEAIDWVEKNGFPNFVSFDNDLGDGMAEGYEFARWLVERDINTGEMPDWFKWYAHTQNPVARDRINGLLNRYTTFRQR